MSFLHSNDNKGNTASFMNNRIPRKKTLTYSGSKSTVDIVSNTAKQSTAANDTLSSFRIPRKSKYDAPSNDKKRTHDLSTSIATTKTPKKVKITATPRDNIVDSMSPPVNDKDIPTYQIVKEGRISGYPIIVSQVGSEHDAILLGCKENPLEYLESNKDGKVKIRWKFAGYNGLVPTHTVRLIKLVDGAPPIRKAAVLSGLLETGDELVATAKDDGIDLGDEEDDDAPILKAIRTDLLGSKDRSDKDGDYNDQEDRDEKLVCYERNASVGYQSGKPGLAASSTDSNGSSLTTNQAGVGSEEISASANQETANNAAESSFTELNPQADETDTNSNKPSPSVVISQSGIKSENDDTDSVATDPMINMDAVSMVVKSDMHIKDEGEETDDDELKRKANTNSHTSQSGIKAEEDGTDSVATDPMINADSLSLLAAYGNDTDDDELPLAVTSGMTVKLEREEETDDELELQPVTSNGVENETETAYECDTDNDEPKPFAVASNMNIKTEDADTDDEMNTSSLRHDNIIPSVSTSTSEDEYNAVVLEFFEKLNAYLEEDQIMTHLDRLIKAHSYLLEAKCPQDMDYIEKGYTAMEAVCQQEISPDTRDLLYELVLLGGKATDKCYEVLRCDFGMPVDHLTVLLLSGYYPTNGDYLFLDELAEGFENDDGGLEPVEMLSILYKTVKLGDKLSCGHVGSTVIMNNINQLPHLEAGVTHSEGGTINPMGDLLKKYPEEKVRKEQRRVRDEIVLEFFKKLNSCLEEQSHELDNEVKDMIKANPYLLTSKCPQDMDNILQGFTAMEIVSIVLDKCRSSKAKKNARRRRRKQQRELSRKEVDTAYECNTDDEAKPLEVKSEMNLKTEEVDTDDKMDAQQVNDKVGKSRRRRRYRKRAKIHIKVEAFPKIQHIEDGNDVDVVVEKLVRKDDWKEMHEEGNLNMVATDEHGKFIAAKITRNSVQTDFRGKRGYEKMRETLSILDEYKPGIEHENDDGSTVYDLIGKDCKDSLNSSLFIFKEGTPDDIIRQAKDGVKDIVEKMETSGERVTKHIYDDNCFSYLSCLSKDETDDDVLIYHFVFPEYKLKITMRSGDVIILNPSVRHSVSNCEQPAYLLSIFKELERKQRGREELKKNELICFVCKLSKNLHDDFSKNQRSKRDNARCKKCEETRKKLLAQRICSTCNATKTQDSYTKSQRENADKAICKECCSKLSVGLPY